MRESKNKTYKTVVATAGKTVDGRGEITADQIQEMAKSYSLEIYGARIWLEHIRGIYADSEFKAYGDVISLSTGKNKDDELQLIAEISPSEALIEINRANQKIYTSIEMQPFLEKTMGAYLVGLAVTDSPASLGTKALKFNAQKSSEDNVFSDYQLFNLSTADAVDEKNADGLLDKVKHIFKKQEKTIEKLDKNGQALFSELQSAVLFASEQFSETSSEQAKEISELKTTLSNLSNDFRKLKNELDNTPEKKTFNRPIATGGEAEGQYQTDC